jgi:hypothetical protein
LFDDRREKQRARVAKSVFIMKNVKGPGRNIPIFLGGKNLILFYIQACQVENERIV